VHDGAPDWVIRTSHGVRTRVSAWRDGRLLAADVPVASGAFTFTADVNIPRLLSIGVAGAQWIPTRDDDPLAPYGQRLYVDQVLAIAAREWVVPIGWFVVTDVGVVGDEVTVDAADLMRLVADDRFLWPRQPPSTATFRTETSTLLGGSFAVTFDMPDRALSGVDTTEWVEDRIRALRDVEAAWPASMIVGRDGVLRVGPTPTVKDTPDYVWEHGQDSAYVTTTTSASRDEVYNAVVARGRTGDGVDVTGFAVERFGPNRWEGPFGRRPRFYFSPLVSSTAQAYATAESVLATMRRRTSQIEVTAPPDPRLYLHDTVAVRTRSGRHAIGLLQSITLPLTPAGGAARYLIGEATWTR